MELSAQAALVMCERLVLNLSFLDSDLLKPTISATFFIEKIEENKTRLESYLNLESLEPFLNTLMLQVLVSHVHVQKC